MRRLLLLAVALVVIAPATAAPPTAGVLVAGASLGGLRLGATEPQVERAWGRAYGRCTSCRHETWYFNYFAFQPRGAGVEFRNGRAVAVFTIYQPPGWQTARGGLTLGDPASRVSEVYPASQRRECGDYYALVLPRGNTVTAFYVVEDRLWGFGLLRSAGPLCR